MDAAPFHAELADGPEGGHAVWLHASDGVRIRVGHWPYANKGVETDVKGTVLMFPGRTEYIEKYGRAAADFAARGFEMIAVDWRGQGLADRLLDDPMVGHVTQFTDYQKDVDAVVAWAESQDLPKPWYLVGHSMGGAIGLHAVFNDLPVNAAGFSAPMWGIKMSPVTRFFVPTIAKAAKCLGLLNSYAPTTKGVSYVLDAGFDDNMLTHDPDMWSFMVSHIEAEARFGLGGPSINWVGESIRACDELIARPAPDLPVVTLLGTDERIVEIPAIHKRMDTWPGGNLHLIDGAEHEVMMELPDIRKFSFDTLADHFTAHP